MATLTRTEPGEDLAFTIAFDAGALGQGTLMLRTTGAAQAPAGLELHLRPTARAFTLGLPKLLRETGFPGDVFALGGAARTAQPVLVYRARPATLARVPAGLGSLAALETFLGQGPQLFALAGYELVSIAFEQGAVPVLA
ncbi:MAG: hypothetical protein JWM80_6533 [Cyanobacteria bacterium RYN_339]|nr:hypothetical protein [Cyanobacteria bacterium RYN_339]